MAFQRKCPVCDMVYVAMGNRAKYCSTRCSSWDKSHPGVKPEKERICLNCGIMFELVHRAMKYCSQRCGKAHEKRRRNPGMREWSIQESCAKCGGPMPEGAWGTQKFCSVSCGLRDRTAERIRVDALEPRMCAYCGNEFSPRSEGNVTCGRKCSRMYHYVMNKELYKSRAVIAQQKRRIHISNDQHSMGVSRRDWLKLVHNSRGFCSYCGERSNKFHMEHVIPLVRGGRHAIGNVVPVCPSCNLSKHDKLLVEWRFRGAGKKVMQSGCRT